MAKIIEFKKQKPSDIKPYIDFDKGWKFTEDDKDFLIKFYEDYLNFCINECGGDFSEEVQEVIDSIKNNGVLKSKHIIQIDAEKYATGFGSNIYEKFADYPYILKFIENSILDVQW